MREPFSPGQSVANTILKGGKPFTAVVSTYDRADALGGTITVESDYPVVFKQLADESSGFMKQVLSGSFDFNNSGGCRNFGCFDKNPAYCFRAK